MSAADESGLSTEIARPCFASSVDPEGNPWCSLAAAHDGPCEWGQQTEVARVDQTILAGDPKRQGNCVSACVATYLGVPLASVPHFVEYDGATVDGTPGGSGWWWLMVGFMAARGLWPFDLGSVGDGEPGELLFVAGRSERGVLHQVLYRDGALWHDPHPSRAGLLSVTEVIAWRPSTHDHAPTAPALTEDADRG